ncbi:hypothetical protein [Rhizobium rhizogenes]|uniref:Uncharacterized protein n=1 Tax=Rhizobium rhizogenes TaxID=359 RepID=A0A7S4ZUT5_RHIRH|nr:hypothetical protein [Rhizobium rhizogenes]QCL09931.1 hypothetical protein pC5.8b_441 [Rhizobium rhizogenes]
MKDVHDMTDGPRACVQLTLPAQLLPFLPEGLTRFQYLNPDATTEVDGNVVSIGGADDCSVAKRDLLFCLYRQKVYAESLPMRRALIAGVTGT